MHTDAPSVLFPVRRSIQPTVVHYQPGESMFAEVLIHVLVPVDGQSLVIPCPAEGLEAQKLQCSRNTCVVHLR